MVRPRREIIVRCFKMPQVSIDQAMQIALQHHQAGRLQQAEELYRQILTQLPDYTPAVHCLGLIAYQSGRNDIAVDLIRRAIALWPNNAEAHSNLGIALKDMGRLDEATAACNKAIALRPNYAEAYCNLGNALKDQGKLDEALTSYREAIALKPVAADWHSNAVYTVCFHPDYDPRRILQEARAWARQHADPLAVHIRPHANDRRPDRKLRVGYVSPDFRSHAEACYVLPLLENHDRSRFEIHCYSSVFLPDTLTDRHRGSADHWHDVLKKTHADLAEQVRGDAIDILVDLTMHMANNRLLMFARKPAPVQVTWLAYPGTTGLDVMDYRLTDRYLDPPVVTKGQSQAESSEHFYSERSVHLPDCWCCYQPRSETPPVNGLPALAAGHATFGCLNNFCKVSRDTLKCWCRLLREVSGSRLLLYAHEGSHRQDVRNVLAGEGVDPGRLCFVGRLPVAEYLRLYHQIDIGLDPFPYSGGTTSCDALWMGVPVVSLSGRTAAGRGTATLLHNIGLPELVADSQEKYIQIAKDLAGDLPRLSQMRSSLRQRMQASPLMDEPRFARNVEAAYREMWRQWCEGVGRPTKDD